MLSRLLPDTVTYYRAVGAKEGEKRFERRVLSPVRLCKSRKLIGSGNDTVEETAILYLFPREMGMTLPRVRVLRDYFTEGACESPEPPRGQAVYRVDGVSEFEGVEELEYLRVIGKTMGGESE